MVKKIMFWMDTKIEEVIEFIMNWRYSIKFFNGMDIFESFYIETLQKRFPKSKNAILLNYRLFFRNIDLIDKKLNPTETLKKIIQLIIKDENLNISFSILYLILTKGNYLQLLKDIDKIQKISNFYIKGNKNEILQEIRAIRISLNLKKKDWRLDREKILPILEQGGDEWLRFITCELFKLNYYDSLSSLLEAISRRFANQYFHRNLKTNFLLDTRFSPPVGYTINWKHINNIVNKYKKILPSDISIFK